MTVKAGTLFTCAMCRGTYTRARGDAELAAVFEKEFPGEEMPAEGDKERSEVCDPCFQRLSRPPCIACRNPRVSLLNCNACRIGN